MKLKMDLEGGEEVVEKAKTPIVQKKEIGLDYN